MFKNNLKKYFKDYFIIYIIYIMTLTLETFLSTFETEQELASVFASKTNGAYKYSHNYYYYYNEETALWEEINKNYIINEMSTWITHNSNKFYEQTTNEKIRSEISNIIKTKTKYSFLKDVINFLDNFIIDKDFINKLDRQFEYLLPIKNNKVIDLRNGNIEYRNKEHYFTYFCDVEPTEKKSKTFEKFINQIMCNNKENVEYLQKILGYCITGNIKAQAFFIFWGEGSNGKSLLLKLLSKLLKEAYKPIAKKIIVNLNKECGSELIDIKNSRLITFSETKKDEKLNDDLIKSITGYDTITARALYKEPISFTLISKLILCTNFKPEFDGNDKALIRRVNFIPFSASFVDKPTKENEFLIDRDLEEKLTTKYLNHFFTFCLEGAIKYYLDKKFECPINIEEKQNKYLLEQNSSKSWFLERVEQNTNKCIRRSDTYKNYEQYCDENGIKPIGKSYFFENISKLIGEPIKKKYENISQYIYIGYNIKDDEDEEDENKNSLDL